MRDELLAAGGDEAQQLRHLPAWIAQKLIDAGIYRMAMPQELGAWDSKESNSSKKESRWKGWPFEATRTSKDWVRAAALIISLVSNPRIHATILAVAVKAGTGRYTCESSLASDIDRCWSKVGDAQLFGVATLVRTVRRSAWCSQRNRREGPIGGRGPSTTPFPPMGSGQVRATGRSCKRRSFGTEVHAGAEGFSLVGVGLQRLPAKVAERVFGLQTSVALSP